MNNRLVPAILLAASLLSPLTAHAKSLGLVRSLTLVTGNDNQPYIRVDHSWSRIQDSPNSPDFPHFSRTDWSDPVYVPVKTDPVDAAADWNALRKAQDCQCLTLIPALGDADCRIIAGCTIRVDGFGVDPAGDLGPVSAFSLVTGINGNAYIRITHEGQILQATASSNFRDATQAQQDPVYIRKPADEREFAYTWSILQKSRDCQCIHFSPISGGIDDNVAKGAIFVDEYRFLSRW